MSQNHNAYTVVHGTINGDGVQDEILLLEWDVNHIKKFFLLGRGPLGHHKQSPCVTNNLLFC